ncbi:unnamed protein product [Ostreobium quekettii]|uniref:Uncharacterized protein n=1 Tax=Ostreobium quekettii TaxID=121088 RepID=A0A8S1JB41_9CHLO|nr:unnamed protein product [Ostreobium quekettii]
MSLEVLKKELVALGAPAAEVEQAFVVETIPIHTTKMDYAGNIRRNSVEVGMEVGALEGASMEVEFGPDWTQNYVFSAVPKTLHRFRSRPSAEKMFKWAVLKAPRGRGPLFQRRWFLVMEMWTSSRLVFLKCDRAARVKILGRVEPPLSINQLVELISGLKLAQVGASLRIDPEFVGLHKVVRDAECACVVKVLNNRPLKSSGRIEKTGFFKSADEAVREERLLDEVARQLKWCQDDVLNDVVTLDDAKLVEVEGGRPGVFESVADFGS